MHQHQSRDDVSPPSSIPQSAPSQHFDPLKRISSMFIIMSFLLVIIICSTFFVNADDAAADCLCDTPQNRGVLLAFQRITGNAWTFDTSIPLCSWGSTAVTCNDTIVTAVDLRGGGLFGNFSATLPTLNSTTFSFSELSSLRTLDLTKNPLLYASIQQFEFPPSLRVLRLPSGFTGKCPEQLLNLTTFSCIQCGLQGPLPTSWCSNNNATTGNTTAMQLLQVIELTGNAGLDGPLPSSWAACPLTLVDVSGIRSAGAIPSSWRDEQQLMAKRSLACVWAQVGYLVIFLPRGSHQYPFQNSWSYRRQIIS